MATLQDILAMQPQIKVGSGGDRQSYYNGEPVYAVGYRRNIVPVAGQNSAGLITYTDKTTGAPLIRDVDTGQFSFVPDPTTGVPPYRPEETLMVPASVYRELQANPTAIPGLFGIQASGLPHTVEGPAPQDGFGLNSIMENYMVPALATAFTGGAFGGGSGLAGMYASATGAGAGAAGAAVPDELFSANETLAGAGGAGGAGLPVNDPNWGADWKGSIDNPGGGLAGVLGPQGIGIPADTAIKLAGGYSGGGPLDSGGAAAAGGGAAGTTAGTAAAGTGLAKYLSGATGLPESFFDAAGRAIPGIIGAFGANAQANSLSDLAKQFGEYGAPSRARYEASMTPGFDPASIPGYSGALDTASQSILRQLSAQNGNPYGNPGGLIEANKSIVSGTALPAIQNYQNQNANAGGLGALASAYPATQMSATQAGSGALNALGASAADVFNPKPQSITLADLLKGMKGYA